MKRRLLKSCALFLAGASLLSLTGCISKPATETTTASSARVEPPDDI